MSKPKKKRKSVVRKLRPGQAVPCDGKIYSDAEDQLWFGIEYKLTDENRFIEIFRFIEQIEKEGFK